MKYLYQNTSLVTDTEIHKESSDLYEYVEFLRKVSSKEGYEVSEATVNLPFDEQIMERVKETSSKYDLSKIKYLFLVGIGGSNLGAKAVYDALVGFYSDIEPKRQPKIIFLDTTNSKYLSKTLELINTLDKEEYIITVVSKSGGTLETIANAEVIADKNKHFYERTVIITGKGSLLWQEAEEKGISHLEIPEKVGGRFSVFSAAGLFPLFVAGLDVNEMLEGAREMQRVCLENNNIAAISATVTFLNYKRGKTINDNFYFASELESLGKWYRQLMGESLGKNKTGITPTVSIGSTDLHSMAQLYAGGPKDKFFTFIWAQTEKTKVQIEEKVHLPKVATELSGKVIKQLNDAILMGVKNSYINSGMPFSEIVLPEISERFIGEYMQFKMIETMYLAKLFAVNAFDQPNVEEYKTETKKILGAL